MAQKNNLTIKELYKRLEEVKKEEQEAEREEETIRILREYQSS